MTDEEWEQIKQLCRGLRQYANILSALYEFKADTYLLEEVAKRGDAIRECIQIVNTILREEVARRLEGLHDMYAEKRGD